MCFVGFFSTLYRHFIMGHILLVAYDTPSFSDQA